MSVNIKRTVALLKRMADRLVWEVRGCPNAEHGEGGEKANRLLSEWSIECGLEVTLIELELQGSLSPEQIERDYKKRIDHAECEASKAKKTATEIKKKNAMLIEKIESLTSQRDIAVSEANRLQELCLARAEVEPLIEAIQLLMVATYMIPFEQDKDDLHRRLYLGAHRIANDAMRAAGALRDLPTATAARQLFEDAYRRETA